MDRYFSDFLKVLNIPGADVLNFVIDQPSSLYKNFITIFVFGDFFY